MLRLMLVSIAILIIVVGAVVLPMPIPFGAIMMVTGLTILISQSPFVARQVRAFRHRNASFDQVIRRAVTHLPARVRDIVRQTDP